MIQKADKIGLDDRVVDYSDPAQLPHAPKPRVRRKDTGEFVAAGVAAGMLIVGGFVYAGYLMDNPNLASRQGKMHGPASSGTTHPGR